MTDFYSHETLSGIDFTQNPIPRRTFRHVTLVNCKFSGLDLSRSELYGCTLEGCDFSDANLATIVFQRNKVIDCDFSGTCFDPRNVPNAPPEVTGTGFRTIHSVHIGGPGYKVGETYKAQVFSTSAAACHPGLYFYPSLEQTVDEYYLHRIIKVRYDPADVHKAGRKYRVKEFTVVREISKEVIAAVLKDLRSNPKKEIL